MSKTKAVSLVPGGVEDYIAGCPPEVQSLLQEFRGLIRELAPGAIETVSYFSIPGYSYPGYDYNGMFAWFSYRKPKVCLHVRPPVLENHSQELAGYTTTKAIVSFRVDQPLPRALVARLVTASIEEMKASR